MSSDKDRDRKIRDYLNKAVDMGWKFAMGRYGLEKKYGDAVGAFVYVLMQEQKLSLENCCILRTRRLFERELGVDSHWRHSFERGFDGHALYKTIDDMGAWQMGATIGADSGVWFQQEKAA